LGLGKSLTGLGLRKFKKPWAWAFPTKFSTPAGVSHNELIMDRTRNVCITKYARLYKLSNGIMVMIPK
jgi:hypothetical protein